MSGKFQKSLNGLIMASEVSHVFCCVLPSVFSLLSLMVGAGIISSMPIGLDALHEIVHGFEIYIIVFSGLILALGWGVDVISRRVDCHSTGCGHEPCTPKKRRAHIILKIATALFIINILVYFGVHENAFGFFEDGAYHDNHKAHDDH